MADEYGVLQVDENDAKLVREALDRTGSVVFPLPSGDGFGCMIITITTKFEKVGVMPFGGNPTGRAYVGVYGRACNHFEMDETFPGYFAEKLNIGKEEAENFATFWRMIWAK